MDRWWIFIPPNSTLLYIDVAAKFEISSKNHQRLVDVPISIWRMPGGVEVVIFNVVHSILRKQKTGGQFFVEDSFLERTIDIYKFLHQFDGF